MKWCPDCNSEKALSDFPPSRSRKDGRGTYCRECMRQRSKASYRTTRAKAGHVVKDRPAVPDGCAYCPDCSVVKPLSAFPRSKNRTNGRGVYCKPCHNTRSQESSRRLHGGGRHYHLVARYGISAADADKMVDDQEGLCAVCRAAPAVHVDHDHVFGTVRGVLCFNCNGGLGQFRDRTDVMRSAIRYLERTTWQRTLVSPGVYRLTSPRPGAAASATS